MAIEWVIERVISLLPVFSKYKNDDRAEKKDQRELADRALEAISEALTETSIYMNAWKKNDQRDKETETRLVKLWSKAAIPIRHIDNELSQICQYKSDYWVNPEHWDPDKTKGMAISLESVKDKYLEKLN